MSRSSPTGYRLPATGYRRSCMALALAGHRRRSSRDVGTLLAGLAAVACFAATLFFINRTDDRKSFLALGAFGIAFLLTIGLGYKRRPYLAFVMPAVVIYTMFVMFPGWRRSGSVSTTGAGSANRPTTSDW